MKSIVCTPYQCIFFMYVADWLVHNISQYNKSTRERSKKFIFMIRISDL